MALIGQKKHQNIWFFKCQGIFGRNFNITVQKRLLNYHVQWTQVCNILLFQAATAMRGFIGL